MKNLAKILNIILGTSIAILSIVTILQVFSRYLFGLPIPWATDVVRIFFIYCIFFGAVVAVREKTHLGVDFLTVLLSTRAQKGLQIFGTLFICFFLVYLTKYGFDLAMQSTTQTMPYLTWFKMTYIYACIPISAILMIIYSLIDLGLIYLVQNQRQ